MFDDGLNEAQFMQCRRQNLTKKKLEINLFFSFELRTMCSVQSHATHQPSASRPMTALLTTKDSCSISLSYCLSPSLNLFTFIWDFFRSDRYSIVRPMFEPKVVTAVTKTCALYPDIRNYNKPAGLTLLPGNSWWNAFDSDNGVYKNQMNIPILTRFS